MGIIESSYETIDVSNLIPSFLQWIFGGTLFVDNISIWGVSLMLFVGLGSFLSLKSFRFEKALGVSGFLTSIIGLFALYAGWINNTIFFLCCIYGVLGLYSLWKVRSGEEA